MGFSFNFDFNFDFEPIKGLIFHGDIHYTSNPAHALCLTRTNNQANLHATNKTHALRLTGTDKQGNPKPQSFGRVLHATNLRCSDSADFNTTVKFNIRGTEGAPLSDGLVFFIVPLGHVFPSTTTAGNFGIFKPSGKNQHVFAVSFDVNPNEPGCIYLGIHLGSRKPAAFTKVPVDFIRQEVTLTVSYVSSTEVVTATASGSSGSFLVSCVHDLSDTLPSSVQVGLASSTSEHVTVHDVDSWTFNSALVEY